MNTQRTRRELLGGTVGIGLALAAGCLDESDSETGSPNENDAGESDEEVDTDRSLYHEWIGAASSQFDFSTFWFRYVDTRELESVFGSLSRRAESRLEREAYAIGTQIEDEVGRENVHETLAFGNSPQSVDEPGTVACELLEGTFDVDWLRDELEADDRDHTQVAGFDIYADEYWPIAISQNSIVFPHRESDLDEFESVLERVESNDYEPGDIDDFERLDDLLGGGTFVTGEVAGEPLPGARYDQIGYGESFSFETLTTTARTAILFDDRPDDEFVEEIRTDFDEHGWYGFRDELIVELMDSAIVATASGPTEQFERY